ncbi:MAG: exosortase/archaeosortase family protein [Syntrophobacteraceae bacterium]
MADLIGPECTPADENELTLHETIVSHWKRIALFLGFLLLGLLVFGKPALELSQTRRELYSHFPAIYLIIGYVLFTERKKIFEELGYATAGGVGTALLGCVIYFYAVAGKAAFSPNDYFAALSLGFAVYLAGIFLWFFGWKTFKRAQFAVFLLVFTIPIPEFILEHVIVFLQVQSYNAACFVLDVLQLYPIKQGFAIVLPDVSVEVAKQCSGIRSSIALLIISVLYGRYFLKTNTSRVLLVILTLFVAPYKNGLRIATLVLLSIYWDKAILSGPLHSAGGIPFFGVGLVWLSLILYGLAKLEKRWRGRVSSEQ